MCRDRKRGDKRERWREGGRDGAREEEGEERSEGGRLREGEGEIMATGTDF